jgi:fido (protein-threonine AMPylation protein)
LVNRIAGGKYIINKTNEKTEQLSNIQAMVPTEFHKLISPNFKLILEKLCNKLALERSNLSIYGFRVVENVGIPNRVVLKISKRPAVYSLKLNEALVTALLSYHDLKPTFSLKDFQKMIEQLHVRVVNDTPVPVKSDSDVQQMCDVAYALGNDLFISKIENFKPDERLTELLRTAEQTNKEYALFLSALDENTRATLKDQWEKRYIYNTNSIEGNTMSQDDVNEFLRTGKKPSSVSKRELFETNNTAEALQFIKIKLGEELSEELAKELHFIIQKNIAEQPGTYKNFYNYVQPNSATTPPQHIKERMRLLLDWYRRNKGKLNPFVLAAIFHMQFELIHPFADGNGRVGRLLMNLILLQNNCLPVTIMEKTKQNYYRALENRSLAQFLLYTLSGFIEEYKR